MKNAHRSTVITMVAGVGLLIPAAIGLNNNGPTILSPLPALTVLPAFVLGSLKLWKAAIIVPMLLFFCWFPGLLWGVGRIPKRSYVLLAVATGLSVLWFIWGWRFGLDYQGKHYTYTVCFINIAAISFLALAFSRGRKREPSFGTNLIVHWILFAWFAWYAFPYLGELP